MTIAGPVHKKRLQVFISSTYTDLREERQAAVEAILTAGHIPAGMELFTSGNETQMDVIKRWIDESDVYMLILGSRYGSVEPITGRSYIHIEYDYAVDQGKPVFSAVLDHEAIDERVRRMGASVVESRNAQALREFREKVCSRLVRFWVDSKDIKLTVHETMAEFARREDLRGWVRASDDVDAPTLATEIARLAKENEDLRRRMSEVKTPDSASSTGIPFDAMRSLLRRQRIGIEIEIAPGDNSSPLFVEDWKAAAPKELGSTKELNLLQFFWLERENLNMGSSALSSSLRYSLLQQLRMRGLVKLPPEDPIKEPEDLLRRMPRKFELTEGGKRFLNSLELELNAARSNSHRKREHR